MDNIDQLAIALAKAQAAMEPAAKDSVNPHFKSRYADLASIWQAARNALTTNGLSVVQIPFTSDTGYVGIRTILLHTSGQSIETEPLYAPAVATIQQLGSSLTYLRRYSLAAVVGIVADDDDDGNTAAAKKQQRTGASFQPEPDDMDFTPPPPIDLTGRATGIEAKMNGNGTLYVRFKIFDRAILLQTLNGAYQSLAEGDVVRVAGTQAESTKLGRHIRATSVVLDGKTEAETVQALLAREAIPAAL